MRGVTIRSHLQVEKIGGVSSIARTASADDGDWGRGVILEQRKFNSQYSTIPIISMNQITQAQHIYCSRRVLELHLGR
jgi:hypothetical protein